MGVTSEITDIADQTFSYIIAGGGTAGLVLASRLSEDENVSILVIEAGKDHAGDEAVLTPGLAGSLKNNDDYDWAFRSTPQDALGGRRIHQGRGKGLGGSSAINGVMAMYPSAASVNAWSELGNEGWSFNEMLPYLEKFSQVHRPSERIGDLCNLGYINRMTDDALGHGPVRLSFGENLDELNGAWRESWDRLLGSSVDGNPRDGSTLGAFQCPWTVDPLDGTRSYSATAYLDHKTRNRPNLTVLTNTMVRRVVLDENAKPLRATGVVLCPTNDRSGLDQVVAAQEEVILAAGALQSPQILELSGIGSAKVLNVQGIPVLLENPAVGENLQDHPLSCQSFEVQDNVRSLDDLLQDGALEKARLEFRAQGSGPLGHPMMSVAYLPAIPHDSWKDSKSGLHGNENSTSHEHIPNGGATFEANDPVALAAKRTRDVTRRLLSSPNACSTQSILIPALHKTADTLDPSPPSVNPGGGRSRFLCINTLLHQPLSRGYVHIISPYVHDKPEYDPRLLSHPEDVATLTKHVLQMSQLVTTPPFSTEVLKPDGMRWPDLVADNPDVAARLIRDHTRTMYHTAGSCAMLPKESGGVVDTKLIVHGTNNLRVVDASIFPLETQGNILCMVYAVAEKAADLIKASHCDRKAVCSMDCWRV